MGERLGLKISVGETIVDIDELITGKKEIVIRYFAKKEEDRLRIRIDRTNEITPLVYAIKVK